MVQELRELRVLLQSVESWDLPAEALQHRPGALPQGLRGRGPAHEDLRGPVGLLPGDGRERIHQPIQALAAGDVAGEKADEAHAAGQRLKLRQPTLLSLCPLLLGSLPGQRAGPCVRARRPLLQRQLPAPRTSSLFSTGRLEPQGVQEPVKAGGAGNGDRGAPLSPRSVLCPFHQPSSQAFSSPRLSHGQLLHDQRSWLWRREAVEAVAHGHEGVEVDQQREMPAPLQAEGPAPHEAGLADDAGLQRQIA
mmetsp:Transcript_45467/g.131628  ORF Transcript_45467/g.131628 Transcript_45467/m.131628 type:complete len:250 (-) Transcript_45467:312-1061(-)